MKKHSRSLFILFILFSSLRSISQTTMDITMFNLLFHGAYGECERYSTLQGSGYIILGDSMIAGDILLTPDSVIVKSKEHFLTYSYNSNSIFKILVNTVADTLSLVRLKNVNNELWRVIKDTLGLLVLDKNYSQRVELNTIDYNSLVFCKANVCKPAFDFWTTSTKKQILKTLSSFFNIKLHPRDFKGKEDVLAKLLTGDRSIYPSM